jgi:hypothetical protein
MTEFRVIAIHSPDLDDAEVRRRLARAYRIILNYQERIETADGDELGNLTPSAADAPTLASGTQ